MNDSQVEATGYLRVQRINRKQVPTGNVFLYIFFFVTYFLPYRLPHPHFFFFFFHSNMTHSLLSLFKCNSCTQTQLSNVSI